MHHGGNLTRWPSAKSAPKIPICKALGLLLRIAVLDKQFTLDKIGIAPRVIIFPFIILMSVDRWVDFDKFSLEVGLSIYLLSFIVFILSFLLIPFYKVIFLGISSFRYWSLVTNVLTLLFVFIMPLTSNSLFFDSFKFTFLTIGMLVNLFLFSYFCSSKYLLKLGWSQTNDGA